MLEGFLQTRSSRRLRSFLCSVRLDFLRQRDDSTTTHDINYFSYHPNMSRENLIPMPLADNTEDAEFSETWAKSNFFQEKWKSYKSCSLVTVSVVVLVSCGLYIATTQAIRGLPSNQPVKIGISHEIDVLDSKSLQLPICTRTFLFTFSYAFGFASELGLYAMAALVANALNYTMLIDDSNWNYGKLSDYFDVPPLTCQPPQNWKEMERSIFMNRGSKEPDHISANRDDRDGYVSYILGNVPTQTINVHSVWNFVNHRERRAVLPATQNLHYSLKPIFDAKSEAIRHIWRPNKRILNMIKEMKKELNDQILQSRSSGSQKSSIDSDLDSPMATKLISVHFRLGDKRREVVNMDPAATGGLMSVFSDPKSFFKVIRDYVPGWKSSQNLPALFVFSDDAKSALKTFDEYQSFYYPNQRFQLLSPPKLEMVTDHGFDQYSFNSAPLETRQKLTSALIRDMTFAVDHSEAIVCSSSSNICNMMFHLRGSGDAIGLNPSIRSVDVRWYPTAFTHEINALSLDPIKYRSQILDMAPHLAADERNYIEI